MQVSAYLSVAAGGALGSVGRIWLGDWIARRFGAAFPFGTLFVNVSGSFLIGLLAALRTADGQPLVVANMRWFLLAGVMGGYTTFSTFSLETLNLVRDGQWLPAVINIVGSVLLCLFGVGLGHVAAGWWNR